MKLLEQRIIDDGVVLAGGVLRVHNFLNHQMDPNLFYQMALELRELYKNDKINKILTIETSGIGIAAIVGLVFECSVLFAKKSKSKNISDDFYTAEVESFTHGTINNIIISSDLISPDDKILIIDDFLANGAALNGLISLCQDAGATVVGCGIAIEKGFQPGGNLIRSRGIRVESLARIKSMSDDGKIEFCDCNEVI